MKPRYRGLSHLFACVAFAVPGIALVATAPAERLLVVAVFAASVLALFGASAMYHRGQWSARAESWMHRLDRAMIFVLIVGTETPVLAMHLPPEQAGPTLALTWAVAAAGIVFVLLVPKVPIWAMGTAYLLLGWTTIRLFGTILESGGALFLGLISAGGVLYTVGTTIYGLRRPNPWPKTFGYHEIFHLFVIAGAAMCYLAITLDVFGRLG